MVLFEEFGGNPTRIVFQTVEMGSACVNAYEGKGVELSCQNRTISSVEFASFGNPQGVCGSFKASECASQVDIVSLLEKVSEILYLNGRFFYLLICFFLCINKWNYFFFLKKIYFIFNGNLQECVGRKSCSFEVSEAKFGWASCQRKRLAVEVLC